MSHPHRVLLILLGLACAATLVWRCVAWRTAAAEFDRAYTAHAEVAAKSARVATLRALPPVSGYGSRPAEDVIQLANRTLEAATLPAARLRSVQPEMDRAIQDDREGRRLATARLSLEPLTVQELGAFLGAWRSRQQIWSVARIELSAITPARGGNTHPQGQYRAAVTVSASYADDVPSFAPKPAAPTGNAPIGAHP
ncbi:MAG: hypothetical protein Q8L55_12375 [Phycisphaerales bacterium]|nr:hypothetical protein [Phycisphaerales bacterium]